MTQSNKSGSLFKYFLVFETYTKQYTRFEYIRFGIVFAQDSTNFSEKMMKIVLIASKVK